MASLGTTNLICASQNPNFNIKSHHYHLSSSSSYSSFQFPPNPFFSLRLSISSQTSTKNKRLGFYKPPNSSAGDNYYYNNNSKSNNEDQQVEQIPYPKPTEIPWSKELTNSVHLIGNVGTPVQIKHLNSGKVLAWTRLGVRKSATDTVWINLTFWNELAHVAHQHVEKGHRLYVSGRLVSDTVEGDDEKTQTYYKVVVQQLNFVEKNFSPAASNEREPNAVATAGQGGNYAGKSGTSTQELWQAFFVNPVEWWDNRKNKRNPKYPDFKHKHTGEALWVDAKYNPPWVRSQLAILDTRMESLHANEDNMRVSYMSSDELTLF